jgi:site-specific DNA recombinase
MAKRGAKASTTSGKAIGYVRVSTGQQVDSGLSLEHQVDRIRSYCAHAKLDLVAIVHDEAVSGGKPMSQRDGGKAVLAALDGGEAHHVVALKLDRLFRSTVDALTVTDAWNGAGIGLHLVDHGGQSINTTTATGRMFITMLAGFAEMERALVSERTTAGLAVKRARGEAVGHTPFGSDRDGKRLVPNGNEAAVIERIVALRAAAKSFGKIADELNRAEIPTKKGCAWSAMQVQRIVNRAA